MDKLQENGFEATIRKSGERYVVQVGAFGKKANADQQVIKLQAQEFEAVVSGE